MSARTVFFFHTLSFTVALLCLAGVPEETTAALLALVVLEGAVTLRVGELSLILTHWMA